MRNKKFLKVLGAIFCVSIFSYAFFPLRAEPDLFDYYYTEQAEEISRLSKRVKEKEIQMQKLSSQAEEYSKLVKEKRAETLTLESKLGEIDNKIAKKNLDIERVNLKIEKVDLESQGIQLKIEGEEANIDRHKGQLADFVRKIYQNDRKTYLEVLLLNDSFSEFFNQLQYLENIELSVIELLNQVKSAKNELEVQEELLEVKREELSLLEIDIEREKTLLESERIAKESLIEQTEQSEEKFQQLVAQVRAEQAAIDQEVLQIEADIKKKLAEKSIGFDWDPEKMQLIWPIPNQGITTYFHDPTYPYRRVVGEHSGLDLRTLINGRPQNGVPLRAPAPGLVIKVIRGGKFVGNAIYVAHSDNFMTVYLHLSRIDVKVDDVVGVAQVIGLTGGMPGTQGAGLSSGPHLHFETRLDGIPVDPLKFLK